MLIKIELKQEEIQEIIQRHILTQFGLTGSCNTEDIKLIMSHTMPTITATIGGK